MTGNLFLRRNKRNFYELKPGTLANISVVDIDSNPAQPRKQFADDALLRLADSIRQHGVLQPLPVRQNRDRFTLVAGERRLRAAVICGLKEVPCVILETDDKTSAELAIIENIQREDLNMFEEAEAIRLLMENYGLTQENIARKLSCSQSYVANKLRLLKLSPQCRQILTEANLTERHARALLRIKDSEQQMLALNYIIRRGFNVAAAEEYVDRLISPSQIRTEEPISLRKRMIIKDIKLFYNSIDHAVNAMKQAGVDVKSKRIERDGTAEITISLPLDA